MGITEQGSDESELFLDVSGPTSAEPQRLHLIEKLFDRLSDVMEVVDRESDPRAVNGPSASAEGFTQ
jgi:hypothetical protein